MRSCCCSVDCSSYGYCCRFRTISNSINSNNFRSNLIFITCNKCSIRNRCICCRSCRNKFNASGCCTNCISQICEGCLLTSFQVNLLNFCSIISEVCDFLTKSKQSKISNCSRCSTEVSRETCCTNGTKFTRNKCTFGNKTKDIVTLNTSNGKSCSRRNTNNCSTCKREDATNICK